MSSLGCSGGKGKHRGRRKDCPAQRFLAAVHPRGLWSGFPRPSPGVQSEVTLTVGDPPLVATLWIGE